MYNNDILEDTYKVEQLTILFIFSVVYTWYYLENTL